MYGQPADPANSPDPEDDPDDDPDEDPSSSSTPTTTSSSSSSSSSSCSAAAITNCQGTAIISGTVTQSFFIDFSTVTACSGSGITSIASSTISEQPSGTIYVHPVSSSGWGEQQNCVLSLMEKPDIDLAGLGACLSTSLTPIPVTGTITLTDSSSAVSASETRSASVSSSSSSQTPSDTPSATPSASKSGTSVQSSSSPSATPENFCKTYSGAQCQCYPNGCDPETDASCIGEVMNIDQDGCKDDCTECNYPPPMSSGTLSAAL